MIFSNYSSRQGEGLSRPTVQTICNGSLATVHLAIATWTPRILAVLSSHNEVFKALLHLIPFSSAASCVFAKMGKRERYVSVSLEGDSHYKVEDWKNRGVMATIGENHFRHTVDGLPNVLFNQWACAATTIVAWRTWPIGLPFAMSTPRLSAFPRQTSAIIVIAQACLYSSALLLPPRHGDFAKIMSVNSSSSRPAVLLRPTRQFSKRAKRCSVLLS